MTANNTYLTDNMARLVAMCEEAVTNSQAYDDPLKFPEDIPAAGYWSILMAPFAPALISDDLSTRPYVFDLQYIIGHITTGYKGQPVALLYANEPKILNYFQEPKRRRLLSTTYPTDAPYVAPIGTTFTRSAGVGLIQRSGIGVRPFGTIFTITVPVVIDLES